jgi:hypothetical protein
MNEEVKGNEVRNAMDSSVPPLIISNSLVDSEEVHQSIEMIANSNLNSKIEKPKNLPPELPSQM